MRDLDNIQEPSDKQGPMSHWGRIVAIVLLLAGLSAGVYWVWQKTTSVQHSVKKENVQIPVTKKNPGKDFTFYKNLKDKNENDGNKEKIVGLIPPSPKPSPVSVSPRFTLQVASMKDYQKALFLSEKLVKKGFPSYVISAEIPQKGTYYRIRVGHYVTRKAAEKVSEQLRRQGEVDVILARENVIIK